MVDSIKNKKKTAKRKSATKKTNKRNLINKTSNLPLIERKYCSCLQQVRSEQYQKKPKLYTKTKKALRSGKKIPQRGEIYSEYAICNRSVYQTRGLKRDRVINCSLSLNFDELTLSEIQAYALDKNIPIEKNKKPLTRSQLMTKINTKINKERSSE